MKFSASLFLLMAVLLYVPTFAQDDDDYTMPEEVENKKNSLNPQLNEYSFAEGLTFTAGDDYRINLRGYMQPYVEVKNYSSKEDNATYSRFRMRRLRLRMTGNAAQQKIDYRFQVDLSGSSEVGDDLSNSVLLDSWIRYSISRRVRISFGQRTTPTDNRELTMGSQSLQLVERSRLTSVFASIREFGFFFEALHRFRNGSYLRPYVTITNGDGINAFGKDFGGLKYGARLDYIPFGLFTTFGQFRQADIVRENSPKLVIGATYSYNQGMSSRRGRGSGEILYLDEEGKPSLPDYVKYGVDFLFKYRGFSAIGEFGGSAATVPDDITTRVRNNGTTSNNFEVDGEDIGVNNYVRRRMMLGRAYNIQLGYVFKSLYSVDVRYAHLDADEFSFFNNGTFYNRPNYYTLGATKYFDRNYGAKIQASLTYVELGEGSNDITPERNPVDGNEWLFRLVTSIAF